MSNRRNIQFTYNPHNKATLLDCNFIVDATNPNGTGVRSLKTSGRIKSVFMAAPSPAATTATSVFASGDQTLLLSSVAGLVPGMVVTDSTTGGNITGGTTILSINPTSNTITLSVVTAGASTTAPGDTLSFAMTAALVGNPNPQDGVIVINLQDNYNRYLGGFSGFVVPVSGTPILVASAGVVARTAYIIVSVGTTSAAQWQSIGLPANITPAVGVAFIGSKTGTATGTGAVMVPLAAGAGVFNIAVIGNANLMNSTGVNVLGAGNGMQLICGCYADTSGDAPALAAPSANTVIGMVFYMNDSSEGV